VTCQIYTSPAVKEGKWHRAVFPVLLLGENFEGNDHEGAKKRRRVVWARNWLQRSEDRGALHYLVHELECEVDMPFAEYNPRGVLQISSVGDDRTGAKIKIQKIPRATILTKPQKIPGTKTDPQKIPCRISET